MCLRANALQCDHRLRCRTSATRVENAVDARGESAGAEPTGQARSRGEVRRRRAERNVPVASLIVTSFVRISICRGHGPQRGQMWPGG